MKEIKGVWRAGAALCLAAVYALAVEDLMEWLGPWRFMAVSAGVLALMWLLVDTTPRTVRYVAPPTSPVDEGERMGVADVLMIVAVAIALTGVLVGILPSLLR